MTYRERVKAPLPPRVGRGVLAVTTSVWRTLDGIGGLLGWRRDKTARIVERLVKSRHLDERSHEERPATYRARSR